MLDKVREEAFSLKDEQRIIYLVASRKRTAKKVLTVGPAVGVEINSEESKHEVEDGQEEKKVCVNFH